jgi:hypothetical protein
MKITFHQNKTAGKRGNESLIQLAITAMVCLAPSLVGAADPVVIDRGPHHRTWQYLSQSLDPDGNAVATTHQYVELATGLHTLTEAGWLDSGEDIEMFADGAVARKGPHQVIFSTALAATPAIDILTPDSKRLQCRLLGLVYRDALQGLDVLIAELSPNSRAELVAPNQIVWRAAFDPDIAADVHAVYSKAGLECEVILRQEPDSPALFGLDPEHTRLEVWTEWFEPPEPRKKATMHKRINSPLLRKLAADPDLVDEFIDFGHMQLTRGVAFRVGDNRPKDAIRVRKQWLKIQQRTFLIESVEYPAIKPLLEGLVAAVGNGKGKKANTRDALVGLFAPEPVGPNIDFEKRQAVLVASSSPRSHALTLSRSNFTDPRPGVSIDWTLVSSASNFTFQNDTTYYVSGAVNLSGSGSSPTNVITFEGGTVIKFAPTNSAKITITGPIKWEGADYRPVVLTARDDHTVGEAIGSASLSGYYADIALKIDADACGTNAILQNVRISHAKTAIEILGRPDHVISHAQFVHCQNGIASDDAIYHVRNALMYDVLTNFFASASGSSTGRCEHITLHQAATLNFTNSTSTNLLLFTNSLLVAITNSGAGYLTNSSSNVGTASSGSTVFQTVGAGSHYLLDNTYRNIGTANIDASLLADLRKKTTYPPMLLTNSIQVDTTLNPQAQRDTDTLDYGFHYEPLDWAATTVIVTNGATLFLKNGVAIGTYGPALGGWGIGTAGSPQGDAKLTSDGSPTSPNWVARYNTVQEQATTNWSSSTLGPSMETLTGGSGRFNFTHWSLLSGSGTHFSCHKASSSYSFRNCAFNGGRFSARRCFVGLTNSLWQRVIVELEDVSDNPNRFIYNNLFFGGTLSTDVADPATWFIYDNLFHKTTITDTWDVNHNYNTYITNYSRLSPNAANDIILINTPAFQTNTLGKFYYPTNDGMLSLLINAGSRNATNASLYHFTLRGPDQLKETNTVVDIGFHYVATANGAPIDTDGDGIPDYQEDANGNGTVESGETNWNDANDLGLDVFITRPRNNSVIP